MLLLIVVRKAFSLLIVKFSFCVAYTKCVATLGTIGFIYLSTSGERLSRGLVSQTCAHCRPIFIFVAGAQL